MANYSIKTDLLRLPGAFVTNIKGRTMTKQCVCIPITESGLFLGQKGCYLNLTAIEMQNPQYGDTHMVKLSLDKEVYRQLTEEQRKAIPILGGLHAIEPAQQQPMAVNNTTETENEEELPF